VSRRALKDLAVLGALGLYAMPFFWQALTSAQTRPS
jgi:hypothetical protein